LHEEEQRLLQQLEATRARLRRLASSEDSDSAGAAALLDALDAPRPGPGSGDDSRVLHVLSPKTPASPAAPRASLGTSKVLPILTVTGAAAFEVGLGSGHESGPQQHVLPIFQLPPVSKSAPVVHRLPKEPTDAERERLQAEARARERAQKALGLSAVEVALFNSVVEGPGRKTLVIAGGGQDVGVVVAGCSGDGSSSGHGTGAGGAVARSHMQLVGLQVPPHLGDRCGGNSPKPAVRASSPAAANLPRSPKSLSSPSSPSSPQLSSECAAAGPSHSREELLRALDKSVHKVQALTDTVQSELADVLRAHPSNSAAAKVHLQRWGATKLARALAARERRLAARALAHWCSDVRAKELADKHRQYVRMQAAAQLAGIAERLRQREQRQALSRWSWLTRFERDNARFLRMSRAAQAVQRVWRGWRGRQRAAARRRDVERREQNEAAARLQSAARGRAARALAARLREERRLGDAASRMQRAFRQRLARRRLAELRARRALEERAALKLQAMWRCKHGQMSYHLLRQARRDAAATRIQAAQRARAARARLATLRVQRRRCRAAVRIQTRWRMVRARRRCDKQRRVVAARRAKEDALAMRVQAAYRGHRGRIVALIKKQAKYAKLGREAKHLKKIQAAWRGHVGRRRAAERRVERTKELAQYARCWQEQQDPDTGQWVFVNLYTMEVRLEPPADGYTRRDGLLALLSGMVVEDPLIVEKRERELKLLRCVECEAEAATRKCKECGDIYCNACFDAIHAKGKLAAHSFDWFQNGAPQPVLYTALSSAQQPASPWVELFDETYQLPYWSNSATGETTWENPTAQAQDQLAMMQQHEQQQQQAVPSFLAAGRAKKASPWQCYADAATGVPYWYNAATGESTWDDPNSGSGAATNQWY
jgi:hypothetical protein